MAETLEEKKERVKAILKEHGIEMAVGSCGCCGSPWVTFKYEGETILDYEDNCGFNTEEEE